MTDVRKRAGVASRESKGQVKSIDDQDRENLAACEEQRWAVEGLYRDGVSASRFGTRVRNNWNRLVADVSAGKLDVVVVWEVSRADRDLETWVPFVATCRRMGVLVHVTSHETTYDPANRRQWRALIDEGVDAADESEKISARSLKGIRGAALAGKQHGPVPYGYTRIYDQHDRQKFTQVPNENAAVVREIVERIARNDPIIVIERDLVARDVPTAHGGRWTRKQVLRAATNPAYLGLRSHNGTITQGNWPALVDAEVWEQAQAVLRQPDRKTTAPGSFKWLLSYMVTAPCKAKMQAVPARKGRKERYRCHEDSCISVGVWEFDEFVTRVVVAWFRRRDARALFERSGEEASAARAEVAELAQELEEARASFARPRGISADALARKERALLPLIEDAQKRIVRSTTPAAVMALLSAAEAESTLIRPAWDRFSIAARRSVIAALMERIEVLPTGERLTRWSSDEDRLRLAGERTVITWRAG